MSAAPLTDSVPNVVPQMPSNTQVYLRPIASVLARSAGSSGYACSQSPLPSEEYRLCLERTENGNQFEYSCTLVPNLSTDMDRVNLLYLTYCIYCICVFHIFTSVKDNIQPYCLKH